MLSRVQLLIGPDKTEKIQNASVAVFGLGGVGSYVAESLARSGVGRLLLVDADVVMPSNINRQLPALHSTIGMRKTEIMQARIADINPNCQVEIISAFYRPGDFKTFISEHVDYIVDAIDSVPSKVDLMINAYQHNIPIFSSMGTGNKLDPTKLSLVDISKTHTCPLAKKIRSQLKAAGITKGISVVYSTESPIKNADNKENTIASMVFVPASAGLLLASSVIRDIIK